MTKRHWEDYDGDDQKFLEDVRKDGEHAAEEGLRVTDNPYGPEEWGHATWTAGFFYID